MNARECLRSAPPPRALCRRCGIAPRATAAIPTTVTFSTIIITANVIITVVVEQTCVVEVKVNPSVRAIAATIVQLQLTLIATGART